MMSPGTYLRKRRVAAGMTLFDVAMMVGTDPHLGEIDKVAWIGRIEADVAALSPDVIASLAGAYTFSQPILLQLITLRSFGPDAAETPQLCQLCGCSALDACVEGVTGETCAWSGPDLCTHCAPLPEEETARAA